MELSGQRYAYPSMPTLSNQEAFVGPLDVSRLARLKTAATTLGVTGLVACAAFRVDVAAAPLWEAALGNPHPQLEMIVNETLPSNQNILVVTMPGFNANYDDMAQAKKQIVQEYNARLGFVRNGNTGVDVAEIAPLIAQQFSPPGRSSGNHSLKKNQLILDGHSMGGLNSLKVAAWMVANRPDITVTVVLDSTPHDVYDVQGFFGQTAVRGLSVSAKSSDTTSSSLPTIGPGARLLAETTSQLADEPFRALFEKNFVAQTFADRLRNLQPNARPLSSSSLADEARTITSSMEESPMLQTLRAAGVRVVRLSPTLDTTIYNDSSVAKFAQDFAPNFCNLPVEGALHGGPNEARGHDAYMKRWQLILRTMLDLPTRRTLEPGGKTQVGRLTITLIPSAPNPQPLTTTCHP
ncbi:MAG: hypothetical protein WAQ24_04140 [Candidatus Saccharimonadales bacterium]